MNPSPLADALGRGLHKFSRSMSGDLRPAVLMPFQPFGGGLLHHERSRRVPQGERRLDPLNDFRRDESCRVAPVGGYYRRYNCRDHGGFAQSGHIAALLSVGNRFDCELRHLWFGDFHCGPIKQKSTV